MEVFDTTVERKTAQNLLKQMKQAIDTLRANWKVKVIAVTSDSSGESKSARKLLGEERPDLVNPDCYAHQVCASLNYLTFDLMTC